MSKNHSIVLIEVLLKTIDKMGIKKTIQVLEIGTKSTSEEQIIVEAIIANTTKEFNITRMKKFILVFLLPFSLSCSEQETPNNEIVPPEGIKIGDQIWTKENLNVSFFQNGDPIPEAKTSAEWIEAYRDFRPAWSYYKNLQIFIGTLLEESSVPSKVDCKWRRSL
jgi:hypothetical protein